MLTNTAMRVNPCSGLSGDSGSNFRVSFARVTGQPLCCCEMTGAWLALRKKQIPHPAEIAEFGMTLFGHGAWRVAFRHVDAGFKPGD